MAETLVSLVVEQLGSIMVRELEQEVRLVVGVENEVQMLTSNLTAIQAVIDDAETKQVKDAIVRDWLEKLKDVAYDIEDVLDNWEAAILSSQTKSGRTKSGGKVNCFFFCCKQVDLHHDIANKIRELNGSLHIIAQEKERYNFVSKGRIQPIERPITTSMIDTIEVKGRVEDKSVLINMLLSDGDRSDLHVISLVGMGGIGKTTLAQFSLNDDRIKVYFDKKIWVCVSDFFDERRVAEAIYESLLGSTLEVIELESLLQKIGMSIIGKKFLLILDNVWEENSSKWDLLKRSLSFGSLGSKVLVTTRKENVALAMGCSKEDILKIGTLSEEDCWLIVSKKAFFNRSDVECKYLEGIGREISKKSKGLPLVAKALGGILQFRKTKEEWQSILKSEIWEEVKETQEEVFAPLWLSYHDLSPALKRCFSFCAIFPKDYEIGQEMLIELWMAQGYLKERQRDNLEIIGEYYFRNLAMRSFFQDFKKNRYDDERINSCKMHDIVHDFAQIVARNECFGVEVNGWAESIIGSLPSKVHHLWVDSANSMPSFNSYVRTKKLRSLLLWGPPYERLPLTTTEELSSLFSELTHLRSLSLRNGDFIVVPSTISKLVQLRWLDLSRNWNLKKLPETLCELHKLETINITDCIHLELPHGIGNLINLKHLHNQCNLPEGSPNSRLPKGIAQLTGLRTLEEVDVGCDVDKFSLSDLKNLNQLRGRLSIHNLGAHKHRHVGEAKEAELKKKEHLTCLDLRFQFKLGGEEREEEDHLLDALEPSPNLEILRIQYYRGTTFPSWMINSLTNLRHIRLLNCEWCEYLPSLGKLPSLESLTLRYMDRVKRVGVELLGIKTPPQIGDRKRHIMSASSSSSSSSSPVVFVAFPKLKSLEFHWMHSWEEWDDYYNNDYYDGTIKPPSITIMPSLRSLTIKRCWELTALPDFILQNSMLHTLVIKESHRLENRYNREEGADWSKISHIPHVTI